MSLAFIPGLLLTCSASVLPAMQTLLILQTRLHTSPVSPFEDPYGSVTDYQNEPFVYIFLVC